MGIIPVKINPKNEYDLTPWGDIETLRPNPARDVLLIVGDATCMVEDLKRFYDFGVGHDTMLINNAVIFWQHANWKFEHFVAGDSHMPPMQELAKKVPHKVIKHCWNPNSHGFTVRWLKDDNRGWNGTSANLGVKIGIKLDYTRMVLAGCPMDFSGHWYDNALPDNDMKTKSDHRAHLWFWTDLASRPVARFIRSMSGNTKDLFGEPTERWLREGRL